MARFPAASLARTTRGWIHTTAYRDQAADLMAKEYPSLKREAERLAINANVRLRVQSANLRPGLGCGRRPWRVLSAPAVGFIRLPFRSGRYRFGELISASHMEIIDACGDA